MKGSKKEIEKIKKQKRLIKIRTERFINVFAGIYLAFWTTLYLTSNKIIAEKNIFCQEFYLVVLSAIVVLILFGKFNKYVKSKKDIKSMKISLKYNIYAAIVILIYTEISLKIWTNKRTLLHFLSVLLFLN